MDTLYWIVAVIFIVGGIVGTVVPALPGAVLVFLGLLLAAWLDGYHHLGGPLLKVLAFLSVLSFFLDFVSSAIGARHVDGTYHAFLGACIGFIAGLFFGIPGLIIGPFIGAAFGEYLGQRGATNPINFRLASSIGWIASTAAKMALAFFMLGIFLKSFIFK